MNACSFVKKTENKNTTIRDRESRFLPILTLHRNSPQDLLPIGAPRAGEPPWSDLPVKRTQQPQCDGTENLRGLGHPSLEHIHAQHVMELPRYTVKYHNPSGKVLACPPSSCTLCLIAWSLDLSYRPLSTSKVRVVVVSPRDDGRLFRVCASCLVARLCLPSVCIRSAPYTMQLFGGLAAISYSCSTPWPHGGIACTLLLAAAARISFAFLLLCCFCARTLRP